MSDRAGEPDAAAPVAASPRERAKVAPAPSRDAAAGATFRQRVAAGVADARVVRAVHLATLHKVDARAASLALLRDPEALRDLAAQIKQHALDRLADYLEQFVANLRRAGAHVHLAPDADAARRCILDVARRGGCRLAVKSKSMATEEVHLNEALEAAGIPVVETDLGEFIVQIDHDRPSHIVTPIIHKDRAQIAAAMQRAIGCRYTEDPAELTQIARAHLRDIFRRCDLGISGVNFGIAETGTLCICTNEGNGRMTTTRPRVHVALMGIEKLIPRLCDLPVFLKLLARSSTGQPMTVYTNLITGPRRPGEPDGPRELHVVLLDNGRSAMLGGEFESLLRCIRCGACLNACPVYRNIGGHAYGGVYGGPIGSLLTPVLAKLHEHTELSRASSLCGACFAACPVKIDFPTLLARMRARSRRDLPWPVRLGLRIWRWGVGWRWTYEAAQWLMRTLLAPDEDGWIRRGVGPLGGWTRVRDLPAPPGETFRARWRKGLRYER